MRNRKIKTALVAFAIATLASTAAHATLKTNSCAVNGHSYKTSVNQLGN